MLADNLTRVMNIIGRDIIRRLKEGLGSTENSQDETRTCDKLWRYPVRRHREPDAVGVLGTSPVMTVVGIILSGAACGG